MEEINLFYQLNLIKNEIDKDLATLERLENDMKVRVLYDSNKELNDRIRIINQDFKFKIEELENKNLNYGREMNKAEAHRKEKEKEVESMNEKFKEVIEHYKGMEIILNKVKSENMKMEKILTGKEEERELERINREYLRRLYDEELKR